jgi:hypothetical protein
LSSTREARPPCEEEGRRDEQSGQRGGLRGISPLCHGDVDVGLFPQAESKKPGAKLVRAGLE